MTLLFVASKLTVSPAVCRHLMFVTSSSGRYKTKSTPWFVDKESSSCKMDSSITTSGVVGEGVLDWLFPPPPQADNVSVVASVV